MSKEYSQSLQDMPNSGELKEAHPLSGSGTAVTPLAVTSPVIAAKKKTGLKQKFPLKNSFVLNYSDSIKLNIVRVKGTSLGYFNDNILTRTLKPISEMGDENLVVRVDSLNKYLPKLEISASLNKTFNVAADSLNVGSDSLAIAKDSIKKEIVVSKTSTIQVSKEQPVRPASHFQDSKIFLLLIVLFSVGLLGYLRLKSSRFIKTIFKGLYSHYEAKRLFSTVNVRNSLHSVMLDFLFAFNVGILVYEVVSLNMGNSGLLTSFLIFIGSVLGVTLYFVLKLVLFRTIGYIFSTQELTKEYLFFVGVVNKTYGIFLTPILVVLPFTSGFGTYLAIGIAASMYVLLYIIQLLRGFKIILGKAVSLFYFILYLCTLEILPAVVAYRILSK